MDLDALSGIIAYKHTGENVTTVTAAVDRIAIKHPLKEICDLELSGQVTFATGRSSMEISLRVAKAPEKPGQVKEEDVLITCAFTMVRRAHQFPPHSYTEARSVRLGFTGPLHQKVNETSPPAPNTS